MRHLFCVFFNHLRFPNDVSTHDIDEQFLWGSDILVSPILHQGQKNLSYYLPKGTWIDFYTVCEYKYKMLLNVVYINLFLFWIIII